MKLLSQKADNKLYGGYNMDYFGQLVFEPHCSLPGTHATIHFPNGYGASIVTGGIFYTTKQAPYELAVLGEGDSICYTTPLTSDVMRYLTKKDVNKALSQIAALPEVTK
jgi:hypothetical protein